MNLTVQVSGLGITAVTPLLLSSRPPRCLGLRIQGFILRVMFSFASEFGGFRTSRFSIKNSLFREFSFSWGLGVTSSGFLASSHLRVGSRRVELLQVAGLGSGVYRLDYRGTPLIRNTQNHHRSLGIGLL